MKYDVKTIIIFVLVVALLGVGYYAISPLFNIIEKDDVRPGTLDEKSGTFSGEQTFENDLLNSEAEPEGLGLSFWGPFLVMGTAGHPASGEALIFKDESGATLRYENFETINGPDLHVYLSKDKEATEYVDLGPIKGTQGNINYEIPEGVDLSEYRYVLTWCEPFNVLFNYAEIMLN